PATPAPAPHGTGPPSPGSGRRSSRAPCPATGSRRPGPRAAGAANAAATAPAAHPPATAASPQPPGPSSRCRRRPRRSGSGGRPRHGWPRCRPTRGRAAPDTRRPRRTPSAAHPAARRASPRAGRTGTGRPRPPRRPRSRSRDEPVTVLDPVQLQAVEELVARDFAAGLPRGFQVAGGLAQVEDAVPDRGEVGADQQAGDEKDDLVRGHGDLLGQNGAWSVGCCWAGGVDPQPPPCCWLLAGFAPAHASPAGAWRCPPVLVTLAVAKVRDGPTSSTSSSYTVRLTPSRSS